MQRVLRRWLADDAGGIVTTVALAAPVLAVMVAGAVDLAAVQSSRKAAQDAVDAAALNVALQLGVADAIGIPARAEQLIRTQLAEEGGSGLSYEVKTTVDEVANTVAVSLTGMRPSFFMNILPPGGWRFQVGATAGALRRQPLCVLSTGEDNSNRIDMKDSSQLNAPGCFVQSNGDIKVAGSAALIAGTAQASGNATGPIMPAPQIGGPAIADPFASMSIKPDGMACTPNDRLPPGGPAGPGGPKDTTPLTVPPGVHCGDIHVGKDQSVTLLAGEHYFLQGKLTLDDNADLQGKDVVLIFDKQSDFDFKDNARVSLEGRTSGLFAGFVLATTRENNHEFGISSSSAAKFLGTIYVPNATLRIDGAGNKVANESAWTVIVAKSLKLQGSPKLVVNSNYGGSAVPVPGGVGPRSGSVTLVR